MTGQRKALIVASDDYEHEGLKHLPGPAADAEALGRVLGDPQIGNFDVQLVYNESSAVIQERIEDFLSECRPDDELLLHFSCHGLKSESGELFLAARNTRPNRLGSTAIPAHFVDQCMRHSKSRRIVLLLDCCYGGAFSQGVTVRAAGNVNVLDSFAGRKLGGGRGRAVITASSAMEYAFEGDQLTDDHSPRPSTFTKALVEGLATGDADRDEDGWVALNELYDYVFDKVCEQNPNQTPSRDIEMQGELYVARSRRRRIIAVPLPPDLDAARKDQNMFTRRGAVNELRSRLQSDDLGVAAGAWEALTELANDNELVSNDARIALREAEVHPSRTELQFERLTIGSLSSSQTVRLLGPPIARACRPHASHGWIHVEETAEGFVISVDTADTGTLNGYLNIKGPTGEAIVTIVADVIPAAPSDTPIGEWDSEEISASTAKSARERPPSEPSAARREPRQPVDDPGHTKFEEQSDAADARPAHRQEELAETARKQSAKAEKPTDVPPQSSATDDQPIQSMMTRIRVLGVDINALGEALRLWYESQGLEAIAIPSPSGQIVQCRSRKKLKLASGTGAELTVILRNEDEDLVVEIGLAKWSAKSAAKVGAATGAAGGLLVGAAAGAAVGIGVVQWRRSRLPKQTIRFLRETAPGYIARG